MNILKMLLYWFFISTAVFNIKVAKANAANNSTSAVQTVNQGVEFIITQGSSFDFKAIRKISGEIAHAAQGNTQALAQLISLFKQNLKNVTVTNRLLVILASIKQAEVERVGQALAQSASYNEKLLGLELLSNLQLSSAETFTLSADIVCNSKDIALITEAMAVLANIDYSLKNSQKILKCLGSASQHQDDAIRSNSLFLIARYAQNTAELRPVITALTSPDPDDRISAMMALQQSKVVGSELKSILLATMSDKQFSWDVRSIAAEALARFDLTQTEQLQLSAFKQSQQNN